MKPQAVCAVCFRASRKPMVHDERFGLTHALCARRAWYAAPTRRTLLEDALLELRAMTTRAEALEAACAKLSA